MTDVIHVDPQAQGRFAMVGGEAARTAEAHEATRHGLELGVVHEVEAVTMHRAQCITNGDYAISPPELPRRTTSASAWQGTRSVGLHVRRAVSCTN
jgi:hypothetical protein